MKFLFVLFFIAIVQAENLEKGGDDKPKRDVILTPIRQTFVRPAMLNRVVQPVIHDFVQPVVHQKEFRTIINPTMMQHQVASPVMTNTMFTNRFVKRSTDNDESKEKRDLFLQPIRQTFVRPAMLNRVVQPVIQDFVQPVVHQKTFQTIINPTMMQHQVASPVMTNTMFTNRFVKRSADNDESKEKRDLFLQPIRQTFVRPAMLNRVVQPVIQDFVQPVVHQKEFQTIVNPVRLQNVVTGNLGMGTTFVGNGVRFI